MSSRDDPLAEIDLTEDEIDAMMAAGEPVTVTGPPPRRRGARFELYRDASSKYRWRLMSASGRVIATGSERYGTRDDAVAAVNEIKANAPGSVLVG